MPHHPEQIEKEIHPYGSKPEARVEAEKRIQQASDLPSYQQNGDGSYQRHFSNRQGRDVTLRVDGNDVHSLAQVEGETRLQSRHGIRLRAADTAEAQSPPAFRDKGKVGGANLTLEIDRDVQGGVVDRRLRLNDIEVNPDRRNSGVGGELLNEAERIGHQHRAREIYGDFVADAADKAQVRSFYQQHGYQFRPGSGGGEEVYKTLYQPESDGAALRRAVAR